MHNVIPQLFVICVFILYVVLLAGLVWWTLIPHHRSQRSKRTQSLKRSEMGSASSRWDRLH